MSDAPIIEAPPTEARLLHMVFPDHTNHLGTLFGGQALAWMDMAAFIAASRYARSTVVTARSEQVDFNLPIHKGDLVEVIARRDEHGACGAGRYAAALTAEPWSTPMPVRTVLSVLPAALVTTAGLLLAGCLSDPGPRIAGSGQCRDGGLDWAIGQPADEATLRRLSRESGAGLVNPVVASSAVRHDARSDRLRVLIDADNRITVARCE